jgi:Flp pilus assembly protein TadG
VRWCKPNDRRQAPDGDADAARRLTFRAGAPLIGLIGHFRTAREAATSVEFALLVVPFLVLTFGVLEVSMLMWTDEALQETAATGARCMGVLASSCSSSGSYSSANSLSYLQTVASGWNVTLPSSAVTLNASATCGGVAGFSQVTINYTFQTTLPGLLSSLASVPLTVQACFPNQTT